VTFQAAARKVATVGCHGQGSATRWRRRRAFRRVAWASAVLAVAGLGCWGRDEPSAGESIVVVAPYEIGGLDPHLNDKLADFSVLLNVYEPLVSSDENLRLRGGLANAWENPTPETWLIHLRPAVEFHSGDPLRAADVVFTIRRLLDSPELEVRTYVLDVEDVTADDELTVRITTRGPSSALMSKLRNVMIVRAGSTTQELNRVANGTGPYRVAWQDTKALGLTRNERYWDSLAVVRKVEFRFGRDPIEAVQESRDDEVSIVTGGSRRLFEAARGSGRQEALRRSSLYAKHLGFDVEAETLPLTSGVANPFRDLRVRRAVSLAIDRDRFVDELAQFAEPLWQPFPPTVLGFDSHFGRPPSDRSRARRLLTEAGYSSGFDVVLLTRNILDAAAAEASRQLGEVGIRAQVEAVSDSVFFERLEDRTAGFWLNRFACSSGRAEDFLVDVVHSRDEEGFYGRYNYGRFASVELDEAIESLRAMADEEAHLDTSMGVVSRAMNEQVVVPLYADQDVYVVDRRVVWMPRADGYILVAEVRLRKE